MPPPDCVLDLIPTLCFHVQAPSLFQAPWFCVLDFLMYGGTVTRGYMKFYLWPGGLNLFFVKTGIEVAYFECTELKSFIWWWVPYSPPHFYRRCLPLGLYCKGRDLTSCCSLWHRDGFGCVNIWHMWAHDLALQETLHVKQSIKNVKQAEQSLDFPCHVLFSCEFLSKACEAWLFFCSGNQLLQRHHESLPLF